jgi:hypothetical protein
MGPDDEGVVYISVPLFTMEIEEEGRLPFLDTVPYGTKCTGNPPTPISTYTKIPTTIQPTNNQSSPS